jgi:TniQ
MNMLVRPAPMPEELDRGYLGRVMRINGLRCERRTCDYMYGMFGLEKNPSHKRAILHGLSLVAGQPLEDFAQHHLLLPIRIEMELDYPDRPHDIQLSSLLLSDGCLTRTRPGAYSCRACVSEDERLYGFSFWRRDHQIPGQWWCKNHCEPLQFDENAKAFYDSPSLSEANAQRVPKRIVTEARSNPNILKFLDVIACLINMPAVINPYTVSKAFRVQARKFGIFEFYLFPPKISLSTLGADAFPFQWLKTAFPNIFDETKNHGYARFDRVLDQPGRCYSLWLFFLAACVLFQDSDEAVFNLTNSSQNSLSH